ncbi:NADH-quinone oxidoreductase subunit NuoG [Rhabdothermincola salaria]|uniref:NADH-quinone oxidoreductase subunit NuoG n=1 Tax=Rhabdothermincola salaria TaxID=2903142 RepID=UPI001E355F30|nr:NADH-quinone oxidoreductase subunit NuoG [Rhabdothermincola salaria]MCD9625742.1 NADH-quinone oxidoreductase subunit NuoG [Rhabdothermincola salaria]
MPDPEAPPTDGVAVEINGAEFVAHKGELLIEAAERSGVYIPRFCYHERMRPVGMCRMCIVEVDTGRGPALQPSCMLECTPGMKVDTESDTVKKVQDGILEFLLINHPLDCPVCDKGGECPLQDQTMAYGPGESRFVEEKRHKEKPIPISDLVLLDRERCILCDRCTRFAKEVAGDPLIHFIDRGNQTEVNTFPDEPFSSYFSGNTVQICPVGALTASSYRFKARPWDLEVTESTCQGCAVGCRIAIDSSRDQVLRFNGVDVDPVNWGWLCDKGRFGFESIEAEGRLTDPLVREGDALRPARWGDALGRAADALGRASSPASIAVIGGSQLTNEDAYAWAKLAKGVLGTDNVDAQLGDGLPAEAALGLPKASIDQVCTPGGTVVLLAPDLKEELPVLFLRLRHAVVEDRVTLVELGARSSGLSELASSSLLYRPGDAAELARALVAPVDATKEVAGLSPAAVNEVRALLAAADGPVSVVLGRPSVAESADGVVEAAAVLLQARPDTRFLSALRRGNVHGALDMGLAPGLLPGRVTLDDGADWYRNGWSSVPEARGLDTAGILAAAADGRIDVLVLLGADPAVDFPDHDLAERGLTGARTVIAVDTFLTESSRRADIVLAAAGFAEKAGTTTNIEGRVSTLSQRVTPPGTARPDWMIAAELASRLGSDLGFASVESVWAEIERLAPAHAGVTRELVVSEGGAEGILVPLAAHAESLAEEPADAAGGPSSAEADALATQAAASEDQAETQALEAEATAAEAEATATDLADHDGELADQTVSAEPAALPRPELLCHVHVAASPAPPLDAYSLRLVATRKLYDLGTQVQAASSLSGLAPGTELRINPYDFERLGVADHDRVVVRSARHTVTVPVAADPGVPRGAAALVVNQPEVRVTDLIDATVPVTDLRIETAR